MQLIRGLLVVMLLTGLIVGLDRATFQEVTDEPRCYGFNCECGVISYPSADARLYDMENFHMPFPHNDTRPHHKVFPAFLSFLDDFFLFKTHRTFIDVSIHDVRHMNLTEYRELYPYPFYYGLACPEVHSMRASWWVGWQWIFEVCVVTFLFLLFRFFLRVTVARPVGKWWGLDDGDCIRVEDSLMQLLFYACSWCSLTIYLWNTDYFWDPRLYWEGRFPHQPMPEFMYWLYIGLTAWYAYSLLGVLFIDMVKSDFYELIVHHVAGLVLLYFSLVVGYWKIGSIVPWCHDICDVILHALKLIKIFNLGDTYLTIGFIPLPFVWLIFRLILFPYMILYPCIVWAPKFLGLSTSHYYFFFNSFMMVLYWLQLFWFSLIVRIGYSAIKGEALDDIREENAVQHKAKAE